MKNNDFESLNTPIQLACKIASQLVLENHSKVIDDLAKVRSFTYVWMLYVPVHCTVLIT